MAFCGIMNFSCCEKLQFGSDNNPKTLGIRSYPSSEIFIVFYDYVLSSAKDACNNITMHVCESKLSALISVGQASVINAKQVHYSCLHIVNMNGVGCDIPRILVCCAMNMTALHSATCKPP